MRRIIYIFTIIALLASALYFSTPLFITKVACKQLGNMFPGSRVLVGRAQLSPGSLSFFDISIKNNSVYDFTIKSARIYYSPTGVFKKRLLRFVLKDAVISISLPQKNAVDFPQYLRLDPKGAFLINILELSNISLNINYKDLHLQGTVSIRVYLPEQKPEYLDIAIKSFDFAGVKVNQAALGVTQGLADGHFSIAEIEYNKLKITDISAKPNLSGSELSFDRITARLLDGDAQGAMSFRFTKPPAYSVELTFRDLNVERLTADLELRDKFEMTGRLSGNISIKGQGQSVQVLSGKLSSLDPGGTLVIKDTKILENAARNAGQSLDILVESFKNYRYNKGIITLSLDSGSLILDTALSGDLGKRNLNITLHNFQLKGEGR